MKLLAAVGTPSWFVAAAFQAVRASCAGEGLPSEKHQTTSLANLAEATPSLDNKKKSRNGSWCFFWASPVFTLI
ncbi:hypothetical protein AZI87_04165 [Bdellovibrio bacteriovorus]|uniref:Uncharacterized protein n=1 Tax=Bdellovibrio bacteriovorus TaxID=959 RepID=A0A162GLN2_BDEBC|nr:hypothetical protein AZI87_04165 [Bdellovibrio bacteriovorus]